jgi:hypothetical protein
MSVIETKRKVSKEPLTLSSTDEEIRIVSKSFSEALGLLTELCEHGDNYYPTFTIHGIVKAPYLWYYCNRDELGRAAVRLSLEGQEEFTLFKEYVLQNLGEEYEAVDSMLSENRITARYFKYLYNPGTILLTDEGDGIVAFKQVSWPKTAMSMFWLENGNYRVIQYKLITDSWNWCFDGVFQETSKRLYLPFKTEASREGYTDIDFEIEVNSFTSVSTEVCCSGS